MNGTRNDLMVSAYHVASPSYFDATLDRAMRVVMATRTGSVRIIDEDGWRDLTSGCFSHLSPEELADFTEAELLVPAGENELSCVIGRTRKAIQTQRSLRIVIHPTAYCQLACDYCGQEHVRRWLSPAHQDALLDEIRARLRRSAYDTLVTCWFGAEPLAGLAVIRAFTPRLREVAAEAGCRYTASMITNGVALRPRVAEELRARWDVDELQVTLDGVRAFHDSRRALKTGGGTYDVILGNLRGIAELTGPVPRITIRANIDRRNEAGVSPLIRELAELGLHRRFTFYAAPIHSWGNDAQLGSLAAEEFAGKELGWLTEMLSLGYSPGLLPTPVDTTCVAVEQHSLVVDATGELFNCTEASYVSGYGTPNHYGTGHLDSGEVPERRNLLAEFPGTVASGALPCSSCRMLPVCGGACPKAWLEGQVPCPSSRWNAEGRLLLWYLAVRQAGAGPRPILTTSHG